MCEAVFFGLRFGYTHFDTLKKKEQILKNNHIFYPEITEEEKSHMLTKEQSKSLKNKLLNNLLYGGIKKEDTQSAAWWRER